MNEKETRKKPMGTGWEEGGLTDSLVVLVAHVEEEAQCYLHISIRGRSGGSCGLKKHPHNLYVCMSRSRIRGDRRGRKNDEDGIEGRI